MGGIAIALRLDQAKFPVQPSLEVIPPSVFLVTGVRELILSAAVGTVLLGLMLMLAAAVRRAWGAFIVPAALLMVVPLNAGGLAWPVGLTVLAILHRHRKSSRIKRALAPEWAAALVLTVVVGVTLLRYTVPPFRYPSAYIQVRTPGDPKETFDTSGGYIGASSDFVYLAGADRPGSDDPDRPSDDAILSAYARDEVLYIEVRSPPEGRYKTSSVLGLLLGSRLAITPLGDLWRENQYHGLRLFR